MKEDSTGQELATTKIDNRIKELGGWRGQAFNKVRRLIHEADPEVTEEWKWVTRTNPGVPVWTHDGVICTGESYKDHLKLTFLRGGQLDDPSGLFPNYAGTGRRAFDIYETDKIKEAAFKKLIGDAVALNKLKKR